ncbi:MAG: biopolymer transporter ExbD [Fibrobacter sp.]|jgi:biopolymer transport protein ExbD|nr:biopolymer transporter ExbD [Fibrobacter sp.]
MLSLFRSSHPPSQTIDNADVDVTPVMNVFIILIPFLVSMAVFTHHAIVEFSLPPDLGTSVGDASEKPVPRLTVRIGTDYLGIVLGERMLDSLAVGSEFPFDTLSARIRMRVAELGYDEVIVASRDNIPFKHVVRVMDLCRQAGFKKVGLSSATADPGAAL